MTVDRAARGPDHPGRRRGRAWRRALRARFGIWRVHEWRNRVLGAPAALWWRLAERRLAAQAAGRLGDPPVARVAVVVPTYRRGVQLRAAVASALEQTVTDLVVVVVDDGGGEVDGLPEDPRLHVVRLPRNTGVLGVVRNVGIRVSRSEYVAFLDDDNTWARDHLAATLPVLQDGAGLVYSDVARRRPDGGLLDTLSNDFDRRRLAEESYIDANSLVVRRSARTWFSRVPRSRATLPKEDWEFVYRVSRSVRVVHVPVVTVDYLVNSSSYYTDWTQE